MTDLEDLTHHFHSEYRKSGIAICVSLAALATSESWWLYGKPFKWVRENMVSCAGLLWVGTTLSALAIIFLSFYVQYRHYFGMKYEAQGMYQRWQGTKAEADKKHNEATRCFTSADRWIVKLAIVAALNAILLFILLICYRACGIV